MRERRRENKGGTQMTITMFVILYKAEVASVTDKSAPLTFWMHLTNITYIGGVFDQLN